MGMYDIQTDQYTPSNFHRGHVQAKVEAYTIKAGATIRARVPVVKNDQGYIEEAAADTLEKLEGISTAEPSGDQITVYLTGDFYGPEVVLPDGVEYGPLKEQCRKLHIFLSE